MFDNVEDSILACHSFASHFPHSLAWLVSEYIDSRPWKLIHRGGYDDEKGLAPQDLSGDQLTEYCAEDCRLTKLAWDRLQPDLARERVIYEHDKALARVCHDMQFEGIGVDAERRRELSLKCKHRRRAFVGHMRKELGCPDFAPGKLDQVREAIFGQLGGRLIRYTAAGKPSTNNETLEALSGDESKLARFAQQLLNWRVVGKIKSTYLDSVLVNSTTGRAHFSIKSFGTVSGRLASRLQSCPRYAPDNPEDRVREIYVPRPGNVFVYFDVCFAEGTLIDTPEGPKTIESLRDGDYVFTYRNRRPAVSKVNRSQSTGLRETLEVTLDNGERIYATPDHNWLVCPDRQDDDPVKTPTANLRVGMRLLPLRKVMTGPQNCRRENLYAHKAIEYIPTHHAVAEAVWGPRPEGSHVHHVDHDYTNNAPDNIVYVDGSKHLSEHGKETARKCWDSPSIRAKMVAALRKVARETPDWVCGRNNPRWGDRRGRDFLKCFFCNKSFERFKCHSAKYCSRACYHAARAKGLNHKIVSIKPAGLRAVWSLGVERDHNYALAAGVFVCNCQAEMRIAGYVSGDPKMITSVEGDVHANNAKLVFPEQAAKGWFDGEAKKDPKRGKRYRDICKNFGFAICYGAEADKLFLTLRRKGFPITLQQCEIILNKLHSEYRVYYKYVSDNVERVRKCGYMRTPVIGRIRWLGWSPKPTDISNFPVQSCLADIMNLRMIELHKRIAGMRSRIVMQIHDALILDCPPDEAMTVETWIKELWSEPVKLAGGDLVLPIEMKRGYRWSELG